MGELGHADDVRGCELDVVVELDPDVFARVQEPLVARQRERLISASSRMVRRSVCLSDLAKVAVRSTQDIMQAALMPP